jgi:uncharacterized membrane protein
MTAILRNKLAGSRDGDDRSGSGGQKDSSSPQRVKNSHVIAETINVGVDHSTAYDQWTQYDKWSEIFKKESARVRRSPGRAAAQGSRDTKVEVTAKIGPSRRQWETEIVERIPGRRLAWRAKGGVQAKGVTTFHRLDDRLTQLMVEVEYRPSGFFETIGNFFRMPRRRVRKDLKLFKHYIELRGEATGSGPGELHQDGGLRDDVDQQNQARKEERR